jgi:2-C-methyl-D-erythritol 2,4-cyclodiphosphate synthase
VSIPFRVGQGFDTHALVEGRPLVLGGVVVPHPFGLAGHSDADVLMHAVTDAVLGAAGLGDLGGHFPASDPRWAGAASTVFLDHAVGLATAAGWAVGNVDATVCCDQPRLGPHIPEMTKHLAAALDVEPGAVRIAPKRAEGLGFPGRGEGICALAVCLLYRTGDQAG